MRFEESDPRMTRSAVAVIAWVGLMGCSESDLLVGPVIDLERAEARWQRAGLDSYVFAVQRMCFCTIESLGPVRVRVENGTVVERVQVDSSAPVSPTYAELFPTVQGLFDLIRSAHEQNAHEVRVTYDPALGVPMDVWIDYIEFAADDELGMRVTEAVSTPNQVVPLR